MQRLSELTATAERVRRRRKGQICSISARKICVHELMAMNAENGRSISKKERAKKDELRKRERETWKERVCVL